MLQSVLTGPITTPVALIGELATVASKRVTFLQWHGRTAHLLFSGREPWAYKSQIIPLPNIYTMNTNKEILQNGWMQVILGEDFL